MTENLINEQRASIDVLVIECTNERKFYELIIPALIEWYKETPDRARLTKVVYEIYHNVTGKCLFNWKHAPLAFAIWEHYKEEVKASCNKKEKEDPFAKLKKAFNQGKRIQVNLGHVNPPNWQILYYPKWNSELEHYRIHPDDVEKDLHTLGEEIVEHLDKAKEHFKKCNDKLQQQPKKEETMKEIKVINKTFVRDTASGAEKEAKNMTDEQLYDCISVLEKEIERLNAIKAKPKKLETHIKTLEGQISDLVALIDEKK